MCVLLARMNDREANLLAEQLGFLGITLASLPAGDRGGIVTYADQSRFDYEAIIFVSTSLGDYVETLRMIRKYGHTIPAIVLSSPDGGKYRAQALDYGADGYVTNNPVDVVELMATINAVIRGREYGIAKATKLLQLLPRTGDIVREPLASV